VDREQALEVALGQIERNFGKGAVMKMSDRGQVSVGAISTGSLSLDLAASRAAASSRSSARSRRARRRSSTT
jgi:RecA/RadA recombinase